MGRTCIPNIGPRQRRLRLVFGAITIAVGLGLAAWLLASDAARWVRLLMIVPSYLAAVSLLQAYEKT